MAEPTRRMRRFEGTCYIPGEQLSMMAKFYRGANLNLNLTLYEDDLEAMKQTLDNSCWCEKLDEVDRLKLQCMKGEEWRVLHDHCALKDNRDVGTCTGKVDKCTSYSNCNLQRRVNQNAYERKCGPQVRDYAPCGPRMVQFSRYRQRHEWTDLESEYGASRSQNDADDYIRCAVCAKDVCAVCKNPLQGGCRCRCPVPNASLCIECNPENPEDTAATEQEQARKNDMSNMISSLMNSALFSKSPLSCQCANRETSVSSSSSCSCEDKSIKKIFLYDCDSTKSKRSTKSKLSKRRTPRYNEEDDEESNFSCDCCRCNKKSTKYAKAPETPPDGKKGGVNRYAATSSHAKPQDASKGIIKGSRRKTNHSNESEDKSDQTQSSGNQRNRSSERQGSPALRGKPKKSKFNQPKRVHQSSEEDSDRRHSQESLHQAGGRKDQISDSNGDNMNMENEVQEKKTEESSYSRDSAEKSEDISTDMKKVLLCIPKIQNSLEQLLGMVSQKETFGKQQFQGLLQPQPLTGDMKKLGSVPQYSLRENNSSGNKDRHQREESVISLGYASQQEMDGLAGLKAMVSKPSSREDQVFPGRKGSSGVSVAVVNIQNPADNTCQSDTHRVLNGDRLDQKPRNDELKLANFSGISSTSEWFTPKSRLLLSSSGCGYWQSPSFGNTNKPHSTEVNEHGKSQLSHVVNQPSSSSKIRCLKPCDELQPMTGFHKKEPIQNVENTGVLPKTVQDGEQLHLSRENPNEAKNLSGIWDSQWQILKANGIPSVTGRQVVSQHCKSEDRTELPRPKKRRLEAPGVNHGESASSKQTVGPGKYPTSVSQLIPSPLLLNEKGKVRTKTSIATSPPGSSDMSPSKGASRLVETGTSCCTFGVRRTQVSLVGEESGSEHEPSKTHSKDMGNLYSTFTGVKVEIRSDETILAVPADFKGTHPNQNASLNEIDLEALESGLNATDDQFYRILDQVRSFASTDDVGQISGLEIALSTPPDSSEVLPLLPYEPTGKPKSRHNIPLCNCSSEYHETARNVAQSSVNSNEQILQSDEKKETEASSENEQGVLCKSRRQMEQLKTAHDTIQTMIRNVNNVIARMDNGSLPGPVGLKRVCEDEQRQSFFVHLGSDKEKRKIVPEEKKAPPKPQFSQGSRITKRSEKQLKAVPGRKTSPSKRRSGGKAAEDRGVKKVLRSVDRVINATFSEVGSDSRKSFVEPDEDKTGAEAGRDDFDRVSQGVQARSTNYYVVLDASSNSTVFTETLRRSLENEITSPNISAAITSDSYAPDRRATRPRSTRPLKRRSWVPSPGGRKRPGPPE